MKNPSFWKTYGEVDQLLKQAFVQMPGGQPPQDPSMTGGDPAMAGAPGGMPPPGMDPTMMGGDPSMMGVPGADPATGLPPGMEAPVPGSGDPTASPAAAPGSPMITISLDQLFEIIQKVLGLAKKVGANGSGIQQAAPAAPAAPEASEAPAQQGLTQDQLKATIYEALGSLAG